MASQRPKAVFTEGFEAYLPGVPGRTRGVPPQVPVEDALGRGEFGGIRKDLALVRPRVTAAVPGRTGVPGA